MLKKSSLLCFAILLTFALPAYAERGTLKMNIVPLPPNLSAQVIFTETSGNKILDADEAGTISIIIQNKGKGDAFDVHAVITASGKTEGLEFNRNIIIGTIPSGQTIKKDITIKASENVPTANNSLIVEIRETNGFDPNPMKVTFNTKAFVPPQLVVADVGINDQRGSGRIEPGGIIELTIRIQNIGHGDARNTIADVLTGKNVFVAADSGTRFALGNIPSGQFKDFNFSFYTNNRIGNGEKIPITVNLKEARPRFNVEQPLSLVMNASQRHLEEVVVKSEDKGTDKADIKLAGGLSVDVDVNIPEGQKLGKYDVAVVIGNRNYKSSGSANVEYAQRDALIMKEYLIQTMGYSPANIIYVEDAPLSKFNEIFGTQRDHKGKLFKWVKEGVSHVFVYYVGHGAPDLESAEAYFMPVDANIDYIKSNGYRLQTFYDNLSKIPAKKMTIVLDTCFAANSEKGLLFKNISPGIARLKKEFQGPANAVLITSGSVDQVSTWYPEKKHSLFTYYFLKGIQGEADTNKDGKITVGKLHKYLKENVPYMAQRLKGNEQQPTITGNAEDVIAVLKKH